MTRVALATCSALPELYEDGPLLIQALAAVGVEADPQVWDDTRTDWAAYDLVVVHSTWDYTWRLAEFLAWARTVPRLANPAAVLAWNTDKTYLRDLAAAGVPVVPTSFLTPGEVFEPPGTAYVVKATVSAGARDAAAYAPGQDASAHVRDLHAAGRTAMVQPYLPAVDGEGETSVLCFEGVVSHGARKGALLELGAGVRNDLVSSAVVTPREPSAAQVAVAYAALAVVGEPLLYARVDVVPGQDGAPLVLELELTEPSLFLRHAPGSAECFAAAVVRWLPDGCAPRR